MIKIKEINNLSIGAPEMEKIPAKFPVIFKEGILKITIPFWVFFLTASVLKELILNFSLTEFLSLGNILFNSVLLLLLLVPGSIIGLRKFKQEIERIENSRKIDLFMGSLN